MGSQWSGISQKLERETTFSETETGQNRNLWKGVRLLKTQIEVRKEQEVCR